ncbi:Putative NmrA-like domain, NAD(P)-binding domain superfamily [Septoria linicola]|uniref:NmrA-like domain, NAD(P)-binding domain superfamily n=1 Tax=Septoria linicola TaxID=215465 RepID=A0A9Q9AKY2_9PEZI|nr:putative NmrA-like domain, NAD(P)-binding domain superfamily [Septoria linicola]USW50930.1 Putative NmrA-like domain, NAD(P)-binding domain superfamily [Septoria linicola]
MRDQTILVDAAIAAGVKRILPSEFGSDPEDSRTRLLPVFGYKVEVEHYCKEKVQGTSTSYTLVVNNEFFDWNLDNSFGVDVRNKKVEIFDGSEHTYSAAPLAFVARGIVAGLQHPIETANRVVRLHGLSMTQNRLQEVLQRFTGKEGWHISHVNLADRETQAYNNLQTDPSNMYAWAVPFLHCAVYGKDFHNDFSKNNDNTLLGLQELSEAEIEEIVKSPTV